MSRLSLNLPEQLVERIDSERGDIARSRYVMRLIEKAYEAKEQPTNKNSL